MIKLLSRVSCARAERPSTLPQMRVRQSARARGSVVARVACVSYRFVVFRWAQTRGCGGDFLMMVQCNFGMLLRFDAEASRLRSIVFL